MLGPIQTIIHLDRSIRLQLALRNVIGKLRTRTQAELIPMPIERMLKALTQGQFHPLHTGRQSAFQTVADASADLCIAKPIGQVLSEDISLD